MTLSTAIVALGHAVELSGAMSPILKRRAALAVELFQARHAEVLILSGGREHNEPRSAAAAMEEFALKEGVPGSSIMPLDDALDTVGEALFARLLCPLPPRSRMLLVTSDYHAARAALLFRFIYGPHFEIDVASTGDLATTGPRQDKETESQTMFERLTEGIIPGDLPAIHERFWIRHTRYAGPAFDALRRRTTDALARIAQPR